MSKPLGLRLIRIVATALAVVFLLSLAAGCGKSSVDLSAIEKRPTGSSGSRVELLIITSERLMGGSLELAEVKERQGYSTAVVPVEEIEKAFPGEDLAAGMRECAAEYRSKRGTRYLLLAGSTDLVPTRYVFNPNMQETSVEEAYELSDLDSALYREWMFVATDSYFAELDADWDVNGNGLYGEPYELTGLDEDEGSFDFDLYCGRIPARDADELRVVTEKIAGFEPLDVRSIYMVAAAKDVSEYFDDAGYADYLASVLVPGWTVEKTVEGDPGFGSGAVMEALNSGSYSVVAGIAHGFPSMMALESKKLSDLLTERASEISGSPATLDAVETHLKNLFKEDPQPPFVDYEMVESLSNPLPFFFLGYGSFMARYDLEPRHCFAGQLLMQRNGAIASCGLSRGGFGFWEWYRAAVEEEGGIQFEIGALIIENVCNENMRFGAAVYGALGEYASKHSDDVHRYDDRKALFAFALLGDPTLGLLR